MNKQHAFTIIIVISIAGILFSGYLSYYELFAGGCSKALISCGPKPISIANLPACVYGLFMYLLVLIIAYTGHRSKD